jgi:branched-chain amino acid transport system ATP-binding protein
VTTAAAVELEVAHVSRSFGGLRAVDDVSFTLTRGVVLGVVGPNGAGKTALLNCMNGIYRVEHGTISFRGRRIEGSRAHQIARAGVARTFQSTEHFADFCVLDHVLLGSFVDHHPGPIRCLLPLRSVLAAERSQRERAMALLEEFDLYRYASVPLRELPYGVQKLVDIARVMTQAPALLLLDEPTSGTTSGERAGIGKAVRRLRELNATMVVVDHDVDFVRRHCDQLLVMNYGKVLGIGKPDEILQREDVVKAYLGE